MPNQVNPANPVKRYLDKHGVDGYGTSKQIQFKTTFPGFKLSKDVKENSFWEVEFYDWKDEVMDQWKNDNIILTHKVHSNVSIVLSKDDFERYLYHPTTVVFGSFWDYFEVEKKIEKNYFDRSEKIEDSGVLAPGYIFSIGVGDGHANYLVTKVTKASVSFDRLGFNDGYRCPHIDAFDGKMPRKYFDKISHFGHEHFSKRHIG